MKYDYFYEEQSEQFVFYKVPKILCTEAEFRELSSDAKLLYGLLLDRVTLSKRNGWFDSEGRIYVIFTIENIKCALNCADKKATRLLVELEEHGLIERKKQGLGKPALIFVKNFIHPSKQRCNNTDNNNTDYSETNLIYSEDDDLDEREAYMQYFMDQLEIGCLMQQYPYKHRELEEILELLVDTVCSNRSTIRIAGDSKPFAVVKSKLMKLECTHIQYVLECLDKNDTEIRNIKQYLLATLYNAPLTISNYYTAMFNNDRANGRI